MSINYFDSVNVSSTQLKEQSFSITNALYNLGAKFSKMSSGKTYTIILGAGENDVKHEIVENKSKNTFMRKLAGVTGSKLKEVAATFNMEIKAKHFLAKELTSQSRPSAIQGLRTIILKTPIQTTEGQGYGGGGPDFMRGCCEECSNVSCKTCFMMG